MTSDNQRQSVDGNSLAIQSGRDTNISQGLSPDDMRQIMDAISRQLPYYAATAREIVDARLADFEERVLRKFTDRAKANPEAFKDPDFQYLLGQSQHAYARSGDPNIGDTLADLIARRSKEEGRSRLSLTLNDAVEKAALLTANEFAELSLCYFLRRTQWQGANSVQALAEHLRRHTAPLLPDASRQLASYSYLEAQSCGNIDLTELRLYDILKLTYLGVFSTGFTRQELEDHLPGGKKNVLDDLVIPCLNDPTKLQLAALSRDVLDQKSAGLNITKPELDNVYNMFSAHVWSRDEVIQKLAPNYPAVADLFSIWDDTPLKNFKLTTVGIAIGHANLQRLTGFDAHLAIWIN